ncbi:protein enabled homolog [Camarhynchus parvulus]|uniref:protein enabled homolog n=1 Tax=Geospiza parvula TaxID=87175 RepID=UPI0012383AF5|nr:protein enabled homolog [Camarhynchus parvulus]
MRAERGLWIFTLRREPPPFIHPHGPRARPLLPPGPAFAPLPSPPPPASPPLPSSAPPGSGAERLPSTGPATPRWGRERRRRKDGGGGRWLCPHVQLDVMKLSVDVAAVCLQRKLVSMDDAGTR